MDLAAEPSPQIVWHPTQLQPGAHLQRGQQVGVQHQQHLALLGRCGPEQPTRGGTGGGHRGAAGQQDVNAVQASGVSGSQRLGGCSVGV